MRMPTALDRTKVEHITQVKRVRWSSTDDNYVILEINDEMSAKGPARSNAFLPGVLYRFFGRWESSPNYGDTFVFQDYTIHNLGGKTGVVAYLCNLLPKDMTPRLADKLHDKYGSTIIDMLRNNPEEIARDGDIDRQTARMVSQVLTQNKAMENTRIELFGLLQGKGFYRKIYDEVIDKWGPRAPQVIRHDPFKLMGVGSGAGFKRCDRLWTEFGLPLDSLKRQLYATMEVIRQDRTGSTWFSQENAAEHCVKAIGELATPERALRLGLRAKRLKATKDDADKVWVTLAPRATTEQTIATAVARLRKAPNQWPEKLTIGESGKRPTDHQMEGLRNATQSPVGIFLGGPGAGKTFTLSFLLREILANHHQSCVAVCAPTGKAAVRATSSLQALNIDIVATTIHQLLRYSGGTGSFLYCASNPLPYKFVIVDESAMIGTPLMASLIQACGTGTHVLFIGDLGQLPPVEHGAPLRDMIRAGIPHGILAEIQRNQGAIVNACAAIKSSSPIPWSERIDLENGQNLRFIECAPTEIIDTIEALLFQGIKGFHRIWEVQVIVGLNDKGTCSRKEINARLQNFLNPAWEDSGSKYRVGDKIICLKNTNFKGCRPRNNDLDEVQLANASFYLDQAATEDPIYVANGEIGKVVAVNKDSCVVLFGENKKYVRLKMKKKERLPEQVDSESGNEEETSLAYAVTCHKMQGSEAPVIIVVCDSAAMSVATQEWWYTAISRASKLCIVVGSKEIFERQAYRQSTIKRKTMLAEKITEALSNEQTKIDPTNCVSDHDHCG